MTQYWPKSPDGRLVTQVIQSDHPEYSKTIDVLAEYGHDVPHDAEYILAHEGGFMSSRWWRGYRGNGGFPIVLVMAGLS